jgi:hypothetical protein
MFLSRVPDTTVFFNEGVITQVYGILKHSDADSGIDTFEDYEPKAKVEVGSTLEA